MTELEFLRENITKTDEAMAGLFALRMKFSAAIHSMRLRTLPLSLAGVVLGIFLAAANHNMSTWTVAKNGWTRTSGPIIWNS